MLLLGLGHLIGACDFEILEREDVEAAGFRAEELLKPVLVRKAVDVDPTVAGRAEFAAAFGNLTWRTTTHIAEQAEFGVHFDQRRHTVAKWLQDLDADPYAFQFCDTLPSHPVAAQV